MNDNAVKCEVRFFFIMKNGKNRSINKPGSVSSNRHVCSKKYEPNNVFVRSGTHIFIHLRILWIPKSQQYYPHLSKSTHIFTCKLTYELLLQKYEDSVWNSKSIKERKKNVLRNNFLIFDFSMKNIKKLNIIKISQKKTLLI